MSQLREVAPDGRRDLRVLLEVLLGVYPRSPGFSRKNRTRISRAAAIDLWSFLGRRAATCPQHGQMTPGTSRLS